MAPTPIITTAPLGGGSADAIVLYVAEGAGPTGQGAEFWSRTGLNWDVLGAAAKFSGKSGQMLDILAPPGLEAQRLLVLGSGKADETATKPAKNRWRDLGGALAGKLLSLRVTAAAVVLDMADATPVDIGEYASGLALRTYKFDLYKSKDKQDEAPPTQSLQVVLHVADPAAGTAAIADRMAVAEGTILARDLVNEPPNVLGTEQFRDRALALSERGLEVEVLDREQMRSLGMNALLAVAQGSARPPFLVIMRWNGGEQNEAPLAFVGKGVVFDSGGISIKQAAGMEDMKGDMGGAAAVTGLMHALAARKARVNAVGVIGLVENMPDGAAMRPGDIVQAMSGTTIEIVNTDAEGRLVLADALWYTQQRFKPRLMVDLATLTGAILTALGLDHAGLFSNDEELASNLLSAGLASGEKLWRMPMGSAYEKMIESRFADIKNTGGRYAGSVTAAHFLAHFHNDVPWAHLDIAGAAIGASASEINTSWAPGFGVALLDRFVRDRYETK